MSPILDERKACMTAFNLSQGVADAAEEDAQTAHAETNIASPAKSPAAQGVRQRTQAKRTARKSRFFRESANGTFQTKPYLPSFLQPGRTNSTEAL